MSCNLNKRDLMWASLELNHVRVCLKVAQDHLFRMVSERWLWSWVCQWGVTLPNEVHQRSNGMKMRFKWICKCSLGMGLKWKWSKPHHSKIQMLKHPIHSQQSSHISLLVNRAVSAFLGIMRITQTEKLCAHLWENLCPNETQSFSISTWTQKKSGHLRYILIQAGWMGSF